MNDTKFIIEALDSAIATQIDNIEYHIHNEAVDTDDNRELLEDAIELLEELRGKINV